MKFSKQAQNIINFKTQGIPSPLYTGMVTKRQGNEDAKRRGEIVLGFALSNLQSSKGLTVKDGILTVKK